MIHKCKTEEVVNIRIGDGPVLEKAPEYHAPGINKLDVAVRIGHDERWVDGVEATDVGW